MKAVKVRVRVKVRFRVRVRVRARVGSPVCCSKSQCSAV